MNDSVVVPVEPTEEMIEAAAHLWVTSESPKWSDIWKAMISAAPTPEQEPLGDEFSKVLYGNLPELYESSPPEPEPSEVEMLREAVRGLVEKSPQYQEFDAYGDVKHGGAVLVKINRDELEALLK